MYLKKFLMTIAAALCMLPLSAINPQNSKMKELNVKKVSVANIPVESVPALLDEEKVAFQPVNTVNWAAFPYTPDVEFRIAHTEDAILLHFKVREASVRAVAGHDNGPVWEDACVEFFSVPAGDGVYYNMECNCAGTLLIGAGAGRGNRQHAPQEVLDKVQRWASLGREAFRRKSRRVQSGKWLWSFPYSAFFLHRHHFIGWPDAFVPTSISVVTSFRPPTSFPGIRLNWRSRTSIARSSSVHCISSKEAVFSV